MIHKIQVLFLALTVLIGLAVRSELGRFKENTSNPNDPGLIQPAYPPHANPGTQPSYPNGGGWQPGYYPGGMQPGYNGYPPHSTGGIQPSHPNNLHPGYHPGGVQPSKPGYYPGGLQERLQRLHRPLVQTDVLLPDLVPGPGEVFEFKNKEKARIVETNEYKWELDEVSLPGSPKIKVDLTFAKLKGKWSSNAFGHQSVHVKDAGGMEMFKIRRSKGRFNPLQKRWSFRILPPGSKDNDDAMFTINKDFFGRGIPILWEKEEWRIYRGREREDNLIYYCVGSWMGFDFKFYRSVADYKNHAKPVAKIEQKINIGAFSDSNWIPDKFKLKVYEGVDSALLLAVSTIIDMVHDTSQSNSHDHYHHHDW